ncbi:hypothetical protein H310_12595 [Aphanomyces invadans]|uniref:DUF304 domain-containing protein n=1 Tax=Aphanomyces invadans TaxID=157072 RepID=A0A024TIY7_9STRA|nr:hypothetical protein H310_12595 [Aphanomyces invadans]ETV93307.1 hypothetical protein H310_12595 [Aphanomyces invadans]|eukprot:XP_008877943.1 hypothetical protein H310_12595 [Aphanomyces invadans]
MHNNVVTIEPLSWRYRIEPVASGGAIFTVPCHKPTAQVVFLSVFMAIWLGMGIFAWLGTGSPIPMIMTLFGASLLGCIMAAILTGVEYVTVTPTVFTYKWKVLCFERTKHFGTQHMGRVHTIVKMGGSRSRPSVRHLLGFQYGGAVVEFGYCLAPNEVEPFMLELANFLVDHAKPIALGAPSPQNPTFPTAWAAPPVAIQVAPSYDSQQKQNDY